MPRDQSTNVLVGWEGYRVKLVERIEPTTGAGKPRVEITLAREKRTFRCSGCGQETAKVHEMMVRCVRDLPILDADTYVWVPRYRVACPTCGPKLEALSWLSRVGAGDAAPGGERRPAVPRPARASTWPSSTGSTGTP